MSTQFFGVFGDFLLSLKIIYTESFQKCIVVRLKSNLLLTNWIREKRKKKSLQDGFLGITREKGVDSFIKCESI